MTQVFIWNNGQEGNWSEISFKAFCKAKKDGAFAGRYFTELDRDIANEHDHIIIECTKEQFDLHKQSDEHLRYLQKQERQVIIVHSSQLVTHDGADFNDLVDCIFADTNTNVEEIVIGNVMKERLLTALSVLPNDERQFVLRYYSMKSPSTRALGQEYGISFQAVAVRLKKIERKLKKLIDESQTNSQ